MREVDTLTPRQDRGQELVGARGHEHEERARWRFLERLEQLVRRSLVETLGLEHDDRLPVSFDGAAVRLVDDLLRVFDANLVVGRVDFDHVRVPSSQREVPRAVVVGCDHRRSEAARRLVRAGAARANEEVRVDGTLRGALEESNRSVLADDPVPLLARHRVILPAAARRAAQTRAATVSTSAPPSTTAQPRSAARVR